MAVTTSRGNGYALYNGNKLPNIDSVWTDKTTYPYAYVQYFDSSALAEVGLSVPADEYLVELVFSSIPCVVASSDFAEFNGTISYKDYSYIHGSTLSSIVSAPSGEWLLGNNDENGTIYGKEISLTHLVWCGEDLLNADNSVYLAASDPIPLDGMTVIEWDGDKTGLDVGTYISEGFESGYNVYKVADYIPMRNGDVFAVHFVASNGAEIIGADDYYEAEFGQGGRCHSHLIISAPAGTYTPTVGTLTATITLPSDGVYMYSSDDGQARTTLYAYPTSGEGGDTYDEKEFLSGLVMGLCSKGNPTFTASDVFGKGYLVGAELRSKRVLPVAYLYNGVKLPKLPVVEGHEFATIINVNGVYELCVSARKFEAYNTGSVDVLLHEQRFKYADGMWVEQSLIATPGIGTAIWVNYDLYYKTTESYGDLSGTLCLAASKPVPVYE